MKQRISVLYLITPLILLLFSCKNTIIELPYPHDLYSQIVSDVSLPEMVDISEDYLEFTLGIPREDYESAVYYANSDGTAPDEIVIIRANDEACAVSIYDKLEKRLEYKKESYKNYLTEYLPIVQKGIVRKDGLTVSLIITEEAERISKIFDR